MRDWRMVFWDLGTSAVQIRCWTLGMNDRLLCWYSKPLPPNGRTPEPARTFFCRPIEMSAYVQGAIALGRNKERGRPHWLSP